MWDFGESRLRLLYSTFYSVHYFHFPLHSLGCFHHRCCFLADPNTVYCSWNFYLVPYSQPSLVRDRGDVGLRRPPVLSSRIFLFHFLQHIWVRRKLLWCHPPVVQSGKFFYSRHSSSDSKLTHLISRLILPPLVPFARPLFRLL